MARGIEKVVDRGRGPQHRKSISSPWPKAGPAIDHRQVAERRRDFEGHRFDGVVASFGDALLEPGVLGR